jgi:two-component system chemotaxis response regulator CheY
MKPILIVDDSPTMRRMVKSSLARLGTGGFVEAGSGLEAIEQLTLRPAAVMVLDLNMPDMHGLDVLKFVRSHPSLRALPVLVLTTRGDDASREMAMAAGATAYVTKPFAPQALAADVAGLLEAAAAALKGADDAGE